MRNKLIKLARRLNKFTIEDIKPLLQFDTAEIESILNELIAENVLLKNDELYSYQKRETQQNKIPDIFQYHTKQNIDIIIRGFCAEIVPEKLTLLVDVSSDSINKFYLKFRKLLFETQNEQLKKFHVRGSQTGWCRKFFDKPYYFYYYDEKLFISDIELYKPQKRIYHSDREYKNFKIIYSYLTRKVWHKSYEKNAPYYLAEAMWRRNKPHQKLVEELNQLLGI